MECGCTMWLLSAEQLSNLSTPCAHATNTHSSLTLPQVTRVTTVDDIEAELKSRMHLAKGHGGQAYDSDDDDDMPRGGQRVQCAQS